MSISFPTLFALGIDGLGGQVKRASAFIVMAILGGAILPKLMGYLGDLYDMSTSFLMPLACFALIASYAYAWPALSSRPPRQSASSRVSRNRRPPPVRLIDTHVHFWHPQRLNYSWLRDNPLLNSPYEVQDYPTQAARHDNRSTRFRRMRRRPRTVAARKSTSSRNRHNETPECAPSSLTLRSSRAGRSSRSSTEIVSSSPKVRGIRRILQSLRDPNTLLRNSALHRR